MYGKVFASMYEGSLYGQWQALVTFQQMIVLADIDGRVDMTPQALAARTSIPFEIIQEGIRLLEAPDSYSRSADHDGRRIVRVDESRPWGWEIVNYKYYRNLATAEDKRRADRERIAAKRAVSQPVAECRDLSLDVANVAHAEAEVEAEVEVEASKKVPTEPMSSSVEIDRVFDHWRTAHGHPRAKLDAKRRKVIRGRLKEYTEADLCQAITGYLNSPHHMGQNDNGTKFDDLELFLRDAKHVDAGLKFYEEPPRQVSSLTAKNIANTQDWMPAELRNAR